MIAAAASVALHVLAQNRAAGLLGYGATRMVVQPERGEAQLFRLLEALAGFQAVGEVDLAEVFRLETKWFPRGATVVVLTPNTRDDLRMELLEMRRRGLSPVAVLIEAEDFGSRQATGPLAAALAASGIAARVVRRGRALEDSLGGPKGGRLRDVA